MEIKKIWGVSFSGTGTTQRMVTHLAKALAEELQADYEEFSFNTPAARAGDLSFAAGELVVLGVPVYAGRVPNLLLPYLQEKVHGNGALALPVVLYGNRNFDDGLMELRDVMADNGFYPVAAGAFVGEHSFSRVLGANRPDEEDFALADQLAQGTCDKIKNMTVPPAQAVEVDGCQPIRPYYTPRDREGNPIVDFLKAKPVTHADKCINCGLCAKLCPMGSIAAEDVSHVAGKCIKCCACVKRCPTGAKYFDHEGYLYHQHELEEVYGSQRGASKLFL